ncbi:glycerophosphodiester phosphodiesterase 1 isoform X2 [Colias croceus]|uniref:glycerophosphodiester phosphodiesterase 1 isoform X2 n=1 Tax=Colias crocea TaxID=72248 RepID=UPI001E27F1A6|nr:glycerophosphodiester phosphodiesterase 1 isoform X2 [Colias croceus]
MATCAIQTGWRASVEMLRYSSICRKISPNAPVFLSVPNSTITHIQRRSLSILPFGLDIGLLGVAVYFFTKLPKPDPSNVTSIFGPPSGSKEGEANPKKVVKCIAHRGAGLDAPENTLQAFKYCVAMECNFIEMDVRTSKDGQLVLLHDQGLERLTGTDITDVRFMDWDSIKNIDVGATHPNRQQFKDVTLCLLEDAIDYLLANKVKMIIDVKGEDAQVVNGILRVFSGNPVLYENAVVTSFNPYVLYQIRKRDPNIVGAMSYRPHCFAYLNYDAENGPTNPRFGDRLALQALSRAADCVHGALWRSAARWCSVSAVLLHKDIVSPREVEYWRSRNVRVAGWCVNRPVEKRIDTFLLYVNLVDVGKLSLYMYMKMCG